MAYVDVKLFKRYYIGAALPVFTRSHVSDSSLWPRHGAAIRDFRFVSELWFFGIYIYIYIFIVNIEAVQSIYLHDDYFPV